MPSLQSSEWNDWQNFSPNGFWGLSSFVTNVFWWLAAVSPKCMEAFLSQIVFDPICLIASFPSKIPKQMSDLKDVKCESPTT